MEEFKDIVKRKRIEKGYSQNQLAKKLNISQSFMNQIESGVRNPRLSLVVQICEVLEIPLFGEDQSHESKGNHSYRWTEQLLRS